MMITPSRIAAGVAVLTLVIFSIDLMVPLGVAGGVPYVAVVLMGLWLPRRRDVVIIAVVTSAATITAYFLSPPGGTEWMVLTNRGLALFAIWVCTLIMTLRKETQYELIVENRRAENYLEISEAVIVHLDPRRRIRLINQRGCEVLGYERHELIGQDWMEICVLEDQREEIGTVHDQVLANHENRFEYFENEVITRSGERRHITWHNKVEYDNRGRPVGTVSAGHDITDLKRVENQLRLAQAELEHRVVERTRELEIEKERAQIANRTKTEFLNITSHELRTPLNAIIGFSSMMTNQVFGKLENQRYESYATDIYNSGSYLLEIINDILDVSKIEAKQIDLDEDTIDLEKDLQACLHMVSDKVRDSGILLKTAVAENLPLLKGDRRRVKQIVVNLLSNSAKFTPDGGAIVLCAGVVDGAIQIRVSDTGIGIPEQNQSAIFDPFVKVENSYVSTQEGTGLGLPIVKSLVEMHGGTIDLESSEGQGSVFTVTFPAERSLNLI